jgi:conjugative transfer signal peptidase TraF
MTRFGAVMATYFATLGIGASALIHPAPKLIWNASGSVPIGLYAVHAERTLHVADLVVAKPPEPLATFLADRRYLARGVPLLKHVFALPGQTVCRVDHAIAVDGAPVGEALDRDRRARPLPAWRGCHVLAPSEVFLMNRPTDSFDSRYFGPLPTAAIIGRADPIWIKSEP